MQIRRNVPIAELTTMRLGGPIAYVAEITTFEECEQAYIFAAERGLSTYILGGGSNVIGHDEGFSGVVLLNKVRGVDVVLQNEQELIVEIASGEELDALADYAAERGLTGVEALSAIPGTIGGAVMQNAGAYGQEIGDVLISVDVYDPQSGVTVTLRQEDLDMSYRHSIFNSTAKGRFFILSAKVRLQKGEITGELFGSLQTYLDARSIAGKTPAVVREAVTAIRAQKLPDPRTEASSGSFFKNVVLGEEEYNGLGPELSEAPVFQVGRSRKLASGWLIERCGLKGCLLHGMRVSDRSALILINESARCYDDLARARREIVSAVHERFCFTLMQEPEELSDEASM